jgi:hypothetical protein
MQPQSNVKDVVPQSTPETIQAQASPDTQEQINWRKFREVRETERKAAEENAKSAAKSQAEATALKAAMEALLNKPQPQQQHQQNAEDMTEDERIEHKIEQRMQAREKEYQQQRMQRDKEDAPNKLVREYKDFHQVCTQENMDYMMYHYPEVANAFNGREDNFEKWSDIYKAVKRFIPNPDSKKDSAKAERNFNKPQSMAVPGATQTGDVAPQKLDAKRRADNWERMQRVIKSGGGGS